MEDTQKRVRRAAKRMGKNLSTAKGSTFVYQAHGSRVLDEFRRAMDAERQKAKPKVVPIARDGTKG